MVPAEPQRVVSVGLTEQDMLLALGVVPVGVTEWYGEHPYAAWPWAVEALGDAEPTVLVNNDGFDFEAIAALDPDLIIGTNAGIDATSARAALGNRADGRAAGRHRQLLLAMGRAVAPDRHGRRAVGRGPGARRRCARPLRRSRGRPSGIRRGVGRVSSRTPSTTARRSPTRTG